MKYEQEKLLDILKKNRNVNVSVKSIGNDVKIYYRNVPASFAIFSSSEKVETGEELGHMYAFGLCFFGDVLIGRTWEELNEALATICQYYKTDALNRVVLYSATLPQDFQFLYKRTEWLDVYANGERSPLTAITRRGLEFRNLSSLTNCRVDELYKITPNHTVTFSGELPSGKIHSKTPLTDVEISQLTSFLLVQYEHILYRMKEDRGIAHVKITATKYIRDKMRAETIQNKDKKTARKYQSLMHSLTIEPEEYKVMRRCMRGAYCHVSERARNVTLRNVQGMDESSAYPYVLLSEAFPMSKGERVEVESMEHLQRLRGSHCLMFKVGFKGLRKRDDIGEVYLKKADVDVVIREECTDGYIVTADFLTAYMTDVDLDIMGICYEWDELFVSDVYAYRKEYLPKPLICFILSLFADKSNRKGGDDTLYRISKNNLNSIFGLMCMSIMFDTYEFLPITAPSEYKDGQDPWHTIDADEDAMLQKYNADPKRCTFYAWGVYTTAYARRNLWLAIKACGSSYVYTDTDDVKYEGETPAFFDIYNDMVVSRLYAMADYYKIPRDAVTPNGCVPGVFEPSGKYDRYLAIGSKMYATETDGKLDLTMAGLPKPAVSYFEGRDAFSEIRAGLVIPKEHSRIYNVTYNDKTTEADITDRYGNVAKVSALSGVSKTATGYSCKTSDAVNVIIDKIYKKEGQYYA